MLKGYVEKKSVWQRIKKKVVVLIDEIDVLFKKVLL